MKKKSSVLSPATESDERSLVSVTENQHDEVVVRGKKFRIRWMHPGTSSWISRLVLEEGNDDKVLCQCAALIVLNGFWRCHLLYWLVWRWFYYIKQYTSRELTPLFELAQKKTAQEEATAYLNDMILLTAFKDTRKQMTKKEAERTLHELRTVSVGSSPTSTG